MKLLMLNKATVRSWLLSSTLLLLGIVQGTGQDAYPIQVFLNGGDCHIESMDVGEEGDVYVTGRISQSYLYALFSPGTCGLNITVPVNPIPGSNYKIFVARFHATDGDPATGLKWLTIGESTWNPSSEDYSGMDIETAHTGPDVGNVYISGTAMGEVEFYRFYPFTSPSINSCSGLSNIRHFTAKFDQNGVPQWMAEAESSLPSYGRGITLDEATGIVYTGGNVSTNMLSSPITFNHMTCGVGCGFITSPVSSPSVGFVTRYTIAGQNLDALQVAENVTALVVAPSLNEVWVTGSNYNAGSQALLAEVSVPGGSCGTMSSTIYPTWGSNQAEGFDIGWLGDDRIAITGAFTNSISCSAGTETIPTGYTDLFIASFDPGIGFFDGLENLSDIGPLSEASTGILPFSGRSSCLAADPTLGSDRIIFAYDQDGSNLWTADLRVSPGSVSTTPGTTWDNVQNLMSSYPRAKVGDIEYESGVSSDRFLAGTFSGMARFGLPAECVMTPGSGANTGFIVRMNNTGDMYKDDAAASMASESGSNITVYPNPTTNRVTIEADNADFQATVEITDMLGKVIYTGQMQHRTTIDVSDIDRGSYIVKTQSKNLVNTTQLVLE